jgi:DNA-binding response OmpR family regulator
MKLLLIDDNPDDRFLTMRDLQREIPDLQMAEVGDARTLAQAIETGSFDVVVTDYWLGDGVTMAAKVLVVEDDPILVETLEYNLTRQGYEVCTAMDGLAALHAARQERPGLIVLDVMLPKLDGFEVCRVLRREEEKS